MVIHALAQPANRLSLLATDMEEELPVRGDARFQMVREAAQDWGVLARSYNPSDVISAADASLWRLKELASHVCGTEVALRADGALSGGQSTQDIRISRFVFLVMLSYAGSLSVTGLSPAISFTGAFNESTAVLQFEVLSPVADAHTPDRLGRMILGELVPGWDAAGARGLSLQCRNRDGTWEYEQ